MYLRVPLSWYHSTTYSFFPDESHAMIHRVYTPPAQQFSKRQFCGFCGTTLSYWSEEPRSEAEFIHVTLGSLRGEDLRDLEELGLIPENEEPEILKKQPAAAENTMAALTEMRESTGVPWFDKLVDGTRLGKMRRSQGTRLSRDGKVKVEWEIVEWTEGDDDTEVEDADADSAEKPSPGKRKLDEMAGPDAAA
jgi:hypothetical protein